ncbi:MAG: hypothetical protein EXS14_05070 [Planctomycetes bacterium]|nr:hypothetical protein [Planctomycetota bacterium]
MPAQLPTRVVLPVLVALCLIWGTTWFVIKWGLDGVEPITAAALRITLSALLMSLLAWKLAAREGGRAPGRWLAIAMGLFNCGGSYAVLYVAEATLPSGLASVLWSIYPLLVAVMAHYLLQGERLNLARCAGLGMGFLGVVTLFCTDVLALGAEHLGMAAFLLLSPLISATGTVIVKRHGTEVSSLLLNRDGMFIGSVFLWILAFACEQPMETHLGQRGIIALLYLAVVGTTLAFGAWFWLMRHMPASKLAVISYTWPLIALWVGAAFGGESVGWNTMLGTFMILAGVALTRLGERAKPESDAK